MRCKTCDYPLWNLPARQCPECGTAFRPSEFEFVANSVQFLCPDCGQAYYGTGEHGHLEPSTFDCVSCGHNVVMDNMVLLPTAGVEEKQTKIDHMPWLQRHEAGRVKSWLRTVGLAMAAPHRLIANTPDDSPSGQAWWFMIVTMLIGLLFAAGPMVIYVISLGFIMGGAGLGFTSIPILIGVIVVPGIIFAWGLISQVLLSATGGGALGIGRTYEAICYSASVQLVACVPCLGFYILPFAWIWWIISATIMMKVGQRISVGRAIGTVAVPALLALAALIASLVVAVVGFTNRMGNMTTTMGPQSISVALQSQSNMQGYPVHVSELLLDWSLFHSNLIAVNSMTVAINVPISDATLADFDGTGNPTVLQTEVQDVIDAMPENVIAYRLADYVFTYPGIDPATMPVAQLWTFVQSLDPDQNTGVNTTQIAVGLADGTTQWLDSATFSTSLTQQNTVRASVGLPPLPDPSTVTHDVPAVDGG